MVTPVELGIGAVVVVLALVFARRILGLVRLLITNAVGGVVVLLIADWFGFGIAFSPLAIGVSAIAGIPGAILLVLLSLGGGHVPMGTGTEHLVVNHLQTAVHDLLAVGR